MRRHSRAGALTAVFLIAAHQALAQGPRAPAQSAQQTVARIDEYMEAAVRVNGFSGSILVARAGQPIAAKGYGMANYELDVPNTPQTVFRLTIAARHEDWAAVWAAVVVVIPPPSNLRSFRL